MQIHNNLPILDNLTNKHQIKYVDFNKYLVFVHNLKIIYNRNIYIKL